MSERVLVLAATQKDFESTVQILAKADIVCAQCRDISDLSVKIGEGAGAVILAKEVLTFASVGDLSAVLDQQPTWSYLPIMVLLSAGDLDAANETTFRLLKPLRNHSLLERPVRLKTLISLVLSSLADRRRQYAVRELLLELEESRKQAIKASQAKSAFLANMSHEIRTPLGAILGFSDLLTEELSEQDRDHYVAAIQRNGNLLSALINDILDLAKVEAGKLDVEKMKVNVKEVIFDVVQGLQHKTSGEELPIKVIWESGTPDFVQSDSTRLKQILINIVGNAVKFTKQGKIEIRSFRSHDDKGRDLLNIEVSDTGVGIEPQHIPHLFQSFTQADSSIARKFGGTGLGLVLSKKLAQALGGELVLVKSTPAVGSVFRLAIKVGHPLQNTPAGTGEKKTSLESTNLGGCHILLVEDSLDNQYLIKQLLERSGAEVETARDGLEGVEKTLKGSFDVVLMDVQMPRLDGQEATRRIRRSGFTKPIIALTAHALNEDRERCFAAGFSHYLTKPIKRQELLQTIVAHWGIH